MLIGRFPLYTDLEVEEIEKKKFDYVLGLIQRFSFATYEFIKNAPDGVLRIIGPFEAKKSKSRLIISSPVPMVFQNLLLNLPRISNCVTKVGRPYVEIIETKDLFDEPGEYVLKIYSSHLDFQSVKEDFYLFLGKRLDFQFDFLEMKRSKNYTLVHLKTLNRDSTAMIKFLRFSGIRENRDKDVLIWHLKD